MHPNTAGQWEQAQAHMLCARPPCASPSGGFLLTLWPQLLTSYTKRAAVASPLHVRLHFEEQYFSSENSRKTTLVPRAAELGVPPHGHTLPQAAGGKQ